MQVRFTDDDIRRKAAELGVIPAEAREVPRKDRSKVVAALVQEAVGHAPAEATEPQLASEIVIQPSGAILVDGEPFPWLVAKQPMDITLNPGGVSTVRLTLMAGSVQILKPEPRKESE